MFLKLPVRDALVARRKAAIVTRQIEQFRRHSAGREMYPGSVIAGSSIPPAFKRAIPIPVVEQQVYVNIGGEINIGPRYHNNERRSGNVYPG